MNKEEIEEYRKMYTKECCVCHTGFISKMPSRWYQFCSERCETIFYQGLLGDYLNDKRVEEKIKRETTY